MKKPNNCPKCGSSVLGVTNANPYAKVTKNDFFCTGDECFFHNDYLKKMNWNIIPNHDILVDMPTGKTEIFVTPEEGTAEAEAICIFAFTISSAALEDINKMFIEITQCEFIKHPEKFADVIEVFDKI